MHRGLLVFLVASVVAAVAAPSSGALSGVVTADDHRAIPAATVTLLAGARVVATTLTDSGGRYRFEGLADGSYRIVVIAGAARTAADVQIAGGAAEKSVTLGAADIEVVEVYENRPVETPARPLTLKRTQPLPYSDEAIESNSWGKAIVLVYIDENGRPVAARSLKHAGHSLDDIGVREVLAARFEPARDPGGRRMRSTMLISLEWPSYWWMRDANLPPELAMRYQPPVCAGTGPLNLDYSTPEYRDCESRVEPAAISAAPFHLPVKGGPSLALPARAPVSGLGAGERRALCEWAAELGRPYHRPPAEPEACLAQLAEAGVCGATVNELVSCILNRASEPSGCGRCGAR